MKIYLTATTRIKDVRRLFNERFPYLKLEFFLKKNSPGEITYMQELISDNARLIDLSGKLRVAEIEINSAQKVSEIEHLFQDIFNLPVQIFRRARNEWVETYNTDYYTLGKQNRIGKDESHAIYDAEILL